MIPSAMPKTDVYKRQTFACGKLDLEAQRLLDVTKESLHLGIAAAQAGARAVSYTHLDVYKRQMQPRGGVPAKGIKVTCSGRLAGADIARVESYPEGTIPLQTLRAVHKYKDSREQFETRTHKRLIDILKQMCIRDRTTLGQHRIIPA